MSDSWAGGTFGQRATCLLAPNAGMMTLDGTNTWVLREPGSSRSVVVDPGPVEDGHVDVVDEVSGDVALVLLTHHHYDHVVALDAVLERFPGTPVLIHANERGFVEQATGSLAPGEALSVGGLRIDPIHTPGHTSGMLSLLVSDGHEQALFTGDTLFKGSVGGVRAPDHTSYEDIKASIMDRLLTLPPETPIHPGHTDPTTVGAELESNRFVRIWRGLDSEGSQPCTALGKPATLILLGDDYDGGHKAWVRWPDGKDDIVPGSKVQTGA
jgi:glyoxylase-like metal-dependent hydrolase (beta-lactamase superfamily II)